MAPKDQEPGGLLYCRQKSFLKYAIWAIVSMKQSVSARKILDISGALNIIFQARMRDIRVYVDCDWQGS